jgi:hypothetical protein
MEIEIAKRLIREKDLVENKRLPVSSYNSSALWDRLRKKSMIVSVTTIIQRAKGHGLLSHDHEVLTASIRALVQHDASFHLWSPYAQEKWTLIISIDDFSRKLLFANFFP